MALNAACVFEFRTTGNAANGGGFKTGASGTDRSQSDTPHATLTTLSVVSAATDVVTVSLTDYTVTTNDVGNIWRNTGGTSTAGWYEIIAVDTGLNTWQLDRAVGTAAQTCAGRMGGAISTFQDAFFETLEPGNKVWIKAGTYNMTESLSVAKDGTSNKHIVIEGYNSARGDAPVVGSGNQPSLVATASNFTLIFDDRWSFFNLQYTQGATQTAGWRADTNTEIRECKGIISNNSTSAECFDFSVSNALLISNCEASIGGASGVGFVLSGGTPGTARECYIHGGSTGIVAGTGLKLLKTIIAGATTAIDFTTTAEGWIVDQCTLYGAETPAGTGIDIDNILENIQITNTIIYGFTTGINQATGVSTTALIDYNNFFNNTTDRTNVEVGAHDTALDPQFTNAAAGDFSVGANMKAVGFPGVFPGGLSTGYLDIGAVQRQEPAAGGGGDVKRGVEYYSRSKREVHSVKHR